MTQCDWRSGSAERGDSEPLAFRRAESFHNYTMNRIADALGTVTSYFFLNDNWMDAGKPEDNEKKSDSVN